MDIYIGTYIHIYIHIYIGMYALSHGPHRAMGPWAGGRVAPHYGVGQLPLRANPFFRHLTLSS